MTSTTDTSSTPTRSYFVTLALVGCDALLTFELSAGERNALAAVLKAADHDEDHFLQFRSTSADLIAVRRSDIQYVYFTFDTPPNESPSDNAGQTSDLTIYFRSRAVPLVMNLQGQSEAEVIIAALEGNPSEPQLLSLRDDDGEVAALRSSEISLLVLSAGAERDEDW